MKDTTGATDAGGEARQKKIAGSIHGRVHAQQSRRTAQGPKAGMRDAQMQVQVQVHAKG